MEALGGPGFSDVVAERIQLPLLPGFIPQLRYRTALRGHLSHGAYAIRPKEALRRGRVVSADELRSALGLSSEQVLILLPFAHDTHLEAMWDSDRIDEIADAGFDLVVAPSYSLWAPRPRTEHLIALKRSLVFYEELQHREVTAIPRVGWVTEQDLRRKARWVRANPAVELVALDWQTYVGEPFRQQLAGLRQFDRLTNARLRYLINGPAKQVRYADVLSVIPVARVIFTNAKAATARPVRGPRETWGPRYAAAYCARCAEDLRRLTAAQADASELEIAEPPGASSEAA